MERFRIPFAAALLALVVASAPARAAGANRPLTQAVSVEGPSRCLEATAVGGQVARWLGRDTIDARVSIVVASRESPAGTTAALSFEVRREGKVVAVRRFEPPPATCADVRRVVAIAIALAIESTILATESEPVAPPPAPAATTAPARANGAGPRFPQPSWGVDGAVLLGVLPTTAFGLRAHADLDLAPHFALRGGTLTTFPVSAPVGPGRADTRLVAADASGCWIALRVPLDVRACGGVGAGGARVDGEAFDPSLSRSFPWVSVMGHIGLRVDVWSWLALEGAVDGLVPIVRPDLEVTAPNGAILFSRSFPVAGAAGNLGVALTF